MKTDREEDHAPRSQGLRVATSMNPDRAIIDTQWPLIIDLYLFGDSEGGGTDDSGDFAAAQGRCGELAATV
jgi:hypothetical protein